MAFTQFSPLTLFVFLLAIVVILAGIGYAVWRWQGAHVFRMLVAGVIAWMCYTAGLGASGILSQDGMPPRMALLLLPMLVWFGWVALAPNARTAATAIPLYVLVGLQSFRVIVEISLHLSWQDGILPEVLTWHGRNMDVFAGLTALPVAWLAWKDATRWRALLLGWNITSMVILAVVVVHGVLTAPGPLHLLQDDVPNVLVQTLPGVYLPAVLVLAAYSLHILAIRRLRNS